MREAEAMKPYPCMTREYGQSVQVERQDMRMIDTPTAWKPLLLAGAFIVAWGSGETSASISVGEQVRPRRDDPVRSELAQRGDRALSQSSLDSPQVFVGDGICDTGARRSLDLWLGDPQAVLSPISISASPSPA